MTKFIAKLILVGLLVSSLMGCGTNAARIENLGFASDADYYRGVVTDVQVLTFNADLASVLCYITIICPVVVLASIPVDLAVDTLSIPHDYARADRKEEMTDIQARMEPNHGYIKFDFGGSKSFRTSAQSIRYGVEYKNDTKKDLRLYVDGAPLVDSSMTAYIPAFKGYLPDLMWMYYGERYDDVKVRFVFPDKLSASSVNSSKVNDWLHSNNNTFVFYDGRHGVEDKESKVSISPAIKYPDVKFSVEPRWRPSSHTY